MVSEVHNDVLSVIIHKFVVTGQTLNEQPLFKTTKQNGKEMKLVKRIRKTINQKMEIDKISVAKLRVLFESLPGMMVELRLVLNSRRVRTTECRTVGNQLNESIPSRKMVDPFLKTEGKTGIGLPANEENE
jgi:hypothetical protein